jgi:peptidoglycan/xylan/chitin deacetylase (PgdA/CDA1 family)
LGQTCRLKRFLVRFYKTPFLVQKLFPQFTWRIPTLHKTIYLTFDDGPIPEVTEFVLEQLQRFGAKATFFCVGDNISKHPAIAERLVREGHRIGNHTHNHLSGWKNAPDVYTDNARLCAQKIKQIRGAEHQKMLFRPPYGQISRKQVQKLKKDYELVMWDVLTYDFDATLAANDCLKHSLAVTQKGSIVVFHDNVKAVSVLEYALPRYLEHFAGLGYTFASL